MMELLDPLQLHEAGTIDVDLSTTKIVFKTYTIKTIAIAHESLLK